MNFPYMSRNPSPTADDFSGAPSGAAWQTWGVGLIAAAYLAMAGVRTICTQQGWFYGNRDSMRVTGTEAIGVGSAMAGLGLFLFCHYFIQNWRPLAWYAVLGKIIGMIAAVGGLAAFCVIWVVRGH